MLIKTRGIVLKTMKYSESSIIADIYTEEKGLRRYIISGVRSQRSRISAGLLQVMSLLELVAYEREDKDLNRLKEIRPAWVYQSVPFDVYKGAVGLFMAEIARKTIREAEQNEPLFAFLFQTFRFLDETPHPVANLHLHFLLELSAYIGFTPGGDFDTETPFFDLLEGLFTSMAPAHPHFLDEKMSGLLYAFLRTDAASCHEINLTREQRRLLLLNLLDYYRLHIEHFPDINAHLILQEVLG